MKGEGKYILKKALEGLLPREILYRQKMGFSIPLAKWFRGELKPVFEERVLSKNSFVQNYFNTDTIRKMWSEHQTGIKDYSTHLWTILILEAWGEKFITSS